MTEENTCSVYRPTWLERIQTRLGFRQHIGDDPFGDAPPDPQMQGWMQTEIRQHFGLLDRIRLLVSGKLNISVTHYTNVQVDDQRCRTDWIIQPPFERRTASGGSE